MQTIIIILIAVIAVLFAVGQTWLAAKERKERKQAEKELREKIDHENKAAEIINEANKTKSDAISGDIDNDLNYMAGKLHEYASK
jgi:FtsZ-interacting cell division protein ZipA